MALLPARQLHSLQPMAALDPRGGPESRSRAEALMALVVFPSETELQLTAGQSVI